MKKKHFKCNEDYFKFYEKMKDDIKIKSLSVTKTKIVVVYEKKVSE